MATPPLDGESVRKSCSATSSFLSQLQNEWNEFLLGIGHSTPIVNLNITATSVKFVHNNSKKILKGENESIGLGDENLVIPLSFDVLKQLFSPSKFVGDDASKIEIFNTIKKNPSLSCDALKKLRKLLFPVADSSTEVSDWPTPSPKRNARHSAPLRLCSKNQRKILSQPPERKCPRSNNGQEDVAKEKPNPIGVLLDSTNGNKTPVRRKEFSKNEEKKTKNNQREEKKELMYSSIYDLVISNGSDSASLFYDTAKYTGKDRKWKPTIVFTYFNHVDLAKMYEIVKELGYFRIENTVTSRTTHVICGTSKKTINLCKAVARGCWILNKNWVFDSADENRWLLEERFEVAHLWPAIKENRLKRQEYGKLYQCDVFEKAGSMFVSKLCTQPSADDLKELITLAGGRLVDSSRKASLIIGSVPKQRYVKEGWILNCILRGKLLNI